MIHASNAECLNNGPSQKSASELLHLRYQCRVLRGVSGVRCATDSAWCLERAVGVPSCGRCGVCIKSCNECVVRSLQCEVGCRAPRHPPHLVLSAAKRQERGAKSRRAPGAPPLWVPSGAQDVKPVERKRASPLSYGQEELFTLLDLCVSSLASDGL